MSGGKWIKKYIVRSESDPSKTYVVAIDRNDNWGCSCPQWKFHHRDCKHIKSVLNGKADVVSEEIIDTDDFEAGCRSEKGRAVKARAPKRNKPEVIDDPFDDESGKGVEKKESFIEKCKRTALWR